jgi:hypothetical protein
VKVEVELASTENEPLCEETLTDVALFEEP